MARDPVFSITDLRGGVNDSDSPTLLTDNQVVAARNVDLRDGALGAKRRGTIGIDLTGAIFDSPVVSLFRHTPTALLGNDELWGIDKNGHIDRRVGGSWQGGVAKVNDHVVISAFLDTDQAANYAPIAVSLHGKLFIAAKGTHDRLLVWDGTVLRWAGLAQPPDPSVAATAVAGSYTGTRYIRIRYIVKAGDVIRRRSEPSGVVSFAPDGTKTGIVITKPSGTEATSSAAMEGQTHWEVEASIDNILFYRIATVAIGTSTHTDTTVFSVGYSTFPLSEQIGEYVPPGAASHVAVDEDRLVMAGSYFTPGLDSTVWWTPVGAATGVGNDERIPTATSQFISFDGLDGGGVTALVPGVTGSIFVFKLSRVYRMARTGVLSSAYAPITESLARGSLPRGAVAGTDLSGVPCVYFLDQALGLCRLGQRGLEDHIAQPVLDTWKLRARSAIIGPRILYYPELEQVCYSVPIGDTQYPNLMFVHEARHGANLYHDGVPAIARTLTLFPDADRVLKPVIGTVLMALPGGGTTYIHQCDTGTTDTGTPYRGYIITKPYSLGEFWQKFGVMAGVLVGRAATGTTIWLNLIRNFGVEQRAVTVSMTPAGAEAHVVRPIDNASMSELNTIQIEIGDQAASAQEWSLDRLVFRVRAEEGSA